MIEHYDKIKLMNIKKRDENESNWYKKKETNKKKSHVNRTINLSIGIIISVLW